jgi:hypothetical protein
MDRWMGSRTARWVIVLGAGLLALRMGLTKYRLGAEETREAPPKTRTTPRPEREALRYGGKNFDECRIELEIELKSEVRVDGLAAMAAFGANGYASEATRTIVDLMAGYDLDTDNAKDMEVVKAAFAAILKIGKPALPVLWEGVRGDSERSRLFAIKCMTDFNADWHPPVAEILKAARHEDVDVRVIALLLMANVKNKPKSCLPVLLKCLNDKEEGVREKAICRLDEMVPEANEVMSALSTAIGDSWPVVRFRALGMAGRYRAEAKPVVPVLLKRLEKPDDLNQPSVIFPEDEFVLIMDTLAAIGPPAEVALPRLRKLREEMINAPRRYTEPRSEIIDPRRYTEKPRSEIIDATIKKIEGK